MAQQPNQPELIPIHELVGSNTLTNSITVDFIKGVCVGEKLRAEGRVIEFNGKRAALVEGFLFNQQDELCAKSKGDFTVLSTKLAKRIGIVDDNHRSINQHWI